MIIEDIDTRILTGRVTAATLKMMMTLITTSAELRDTAHLRVAHLTPDNMRDTQHRGVAVFSYLRGPGHNWLGLSGTRHKGDHYTNNTPHTHNTPLIHSTPESSTRDKILTLKTLAHGQKKALLTLLIFPQIFKT